MTATTTVPAVPKWAPAEAAKFSGTVGGARKVGGLMLTPIDRQAAVDDAHQQAANTPARETSRTSPPSSVMPSSRMFAAVRRCRR